jgi:hypothetical protein
MIIINLLITAIIHDQSASETVYNNSFLPVELFESVFPIDDCNPE